MCLLTYDLYLVSYRSLPSLHAIIGVMLPWYICLYIYQHYQLMPWEVITMVTLIIFCEFEFVSYII